MVIQRPQTSSYAVKPPRAFKYESDLETKSMPATHRSPSKFVPSVDHSESSGSHELGVVPEYIKKLKSHRVNFPESKYEKPEMMAKKPSSIRRPTTPRFTSRLEKIPEDSEPISIGDGKKETVSKFQSEINDLKQFVETSIDNIKANCEDSQKALFKNFEALNAKVEEAHKNGFESSVLKTREIANLMKKNDALNTSLKHKADENVKLKRELAELRNELRGTSIETASTFSSRTTNL